ncbi:Ycf66 family protein [Cronbergia sp. UHCC 0137]|uniref:Ycf66 family protein n=1 Tax=Cronbergia sp. UHCC 0137 TaxID=3110239 RepID=UPI002B218EEB|nr:Ycf66 family protein [Cronbergia sp. UHCC 0137]MEA5619146.1 Ycf66 family protein [Cronbergia sp. UHCC 0137]
MLAHILALIVAVGSLTIYIAAFFFPEIHRKNDFIWSGVGLFYALVLWIFAPRLTGGLLLGHVASVALLVWFGWETLSLRRQLTPQIQQTPIPNPEVVKSSLQEQVSKFSLQEKLSQWQKAVSGIFGGIKDRIQPPKQKPVVEIIDNTTTVPPEPSQTETPIEEVTVLASEQPTAILPPVVHPNPPSAELVEAAQQQPDETPNIPVEEIAPDAILAPPAEAPPTD